MSNPPIMIFHTGTASLQPLGLPERAGKTPEKIEEDSK